MSVDDPFVVTGKPTIVGTGLISLDLVLGPDGSKSPRVYAGGTCGNILIIMSYLGWRSFPVARMNGDKASKLVLQDLMRWRVNIDCATAKPGSNTPVIVQRIQEAQNGKASHRFSWKCPKCGAWLPSYSAVPAAAAQAISEVVKSPRVFFFDRVSRGAINLAKHYATKGALVVFEPSGRGNAHLLSEALECSHVVKYSDQRFDNIEEINRVPGPLLEIQTRGAQGLRYRWIGRKMGKKNWKSFAALAVTGLKDTSGAGDWCCAGIVHRLGSSGLAGFQAATEIEIQAAMRFGQAMAAWNCKFNGPRAGMYSTSKKKFKLALNKLFSGHDALAESGSGGEDKVPRLKCLGASCTKVLRTELSVTKVA